MNMPLVSVIMPALDAAPWIGEAIASIGAQTWPHDALEVIVVDDGSRDGTASLAERALEAAGLGGQVLRTNAHRGPAAARNDGIARARGEWVQLLDADDLLAAHKIATQMAVAGACAPEVAVVVSPWQRLAERGGAWVADGPVVTPRVGEDALTSVLGADNFIATGSQLVRRTWLVGVGGYDARLLLVEDVHLLARLVMAGGRIVSASSTAPLFWYRQRPGSLSSRDQRGFVQAQVRNARLVEDYWRSIAALTPERGRFLARLYASAVRGWVVDDPDGFERMADRIDRLQPGFVPAEPAALRQLSRLVGYRRAERAAGRYRRLKALVRGAP
jgi:glycosyltransferase involved in cell wall biosynthesis